MSVPILVREASLRTAAVEIRSLIVSGKQVTLAVFRQLKDEQIIQADDACMELFLAGQPWGIVNYFWGKCWTDREHLHVVWQKDDELRRACVAAEHDDVIWARQQGERSEVPVSVASQWRDLHRQLANLDQLFIAV